MDPLLEKGLKGIPTCMALSKNNVFIGLENG